MGMGLIIGTTIQKSERKSVKELVEAEGGSIASEEKLGEKDKYLNNETVINSLFGLRQRKEYLAWILSFRFVDNISMEM